MSCLISQSVIALSASSFDTMSLKKYLPFVFLISTAFANTDLELSAIGEPDIGNYGLEDLFQDIIEQIRNELKAGNPEKGIPPLDPLDIDYKEINIDVNPFVRLIGSLKGVTGQNLLQFNVTTLKVSLTPIRLETALEWEPIDAQGSYSIDGHLASLIPIYGNGSFNVFIDGIYGYLKIEIGSKGGQLRIKKFDVNFGLNQISINIENFLGGVLGDIVCQIINENLPTMVEQFKIGYLEGIKDFFINIINDFIKEKSIEEIIDWISGLLKPTEAPKPMDKH